MLFRLFSCACLAVGLGFGSYTTSHQLAAPQPPPTHWVLRTLDGKPLSYLQPQARPQLILPAVTAPGTPHQGAFQHSVSARLLTIPHVISTMMRRSNQAIEEELRYLNVLEQTNRFEISGDTLHLYTAEQTTPLATFEAANGTSPQ